MLFGEQGVTKFSWGLGFTPYSSWGEWLGVRGRRFLLSVAALSKHRQDVEVALKIEDLQGHSAATIGKELAMGMIAYNLVVPVRRLAAKQIPIEPRRLSFSESIAS